MVILEKHLGDADLGALELTGSDELPRCFVQLANVLHVFPVILQLIGLETKVLIPNR